MSHNKSVDSMCTKMSLPCCGRQPSDICVTVADTSNYLSMQLCLRRGRTNGSRCLQPHQALKVPLNACCPPVLHDLQVVLTHFYALHTIHPQLAGLALMGLQLYYAILLERRLANLLRPRLSFDSCRHQRFDSCRHQWSQLLMC